MKDKIKILIIGNSVTLRVRPIEENSENKNYGKILEDRLFKNTEKTYPVLVNKGFSRASIIEINNKIDSFISESPDYIVINIGVVDASTREIPFWFANKIKSDTGSFINGLMRGIYHHVFERNRTFFVKIRGKKPWINIKNFEKHFRYLIQTLLKDTNAEIICLGINSGSERIEKKIPGSLLNYKLYTDVIKKVTFENKCEYLDISNLSTESHFPDGIHFSNKGHEIIADQIFNQFNLREVIKR